MKKKLAPKTAKGTMRKIEVACAAWIDLLGYGAMLQSAGFDVTSPATADAINRLSEFQRLIASKSCRYFPTFVMNDGAVAYRDLSPRTNTVTYDFIRRAYDLFTEVNNHDQGARGFPGARMVIAVGFRLRPELSFSSFLNEGKAKSIKTRVKEGIITQDQALNEALKTRNTHDTTPELQGNFALTKAYLADSSGKAGGFAGPNCFIDLALFDSTPPSWLKLKRTVAWSSRGLATSFGEIEQMDSQTASSSRYAGLKDAFAVARTLSSAPNVEELLKSSRVTRSR